MFPFPVLLIGIDEKLMPAVRQELTSVSAPVEAEFRDVDTALAGVHGTKGEKRLFLVTVEAPEDAQGVRRLAEKFRGWPILALVDIRSHSNTLLRANRAGAFQVVTLPVQGPDLYAALQVIASHYRTADQDCQVIAFTGSAAGCGATTLSINAAYEIAERYKRRTILIELTQQMGVAASNLDVVPACTLADLLADLEHVDARLVQQSLVRVTDNFHILAGSSGVVVGRSITAAGVRQVLDYVRSLADVIILDVPCTYDHFQFEMLALAGQIVLVGEQSITSIRTLHLLLGTLRTDSGSHTYNVVLNRYNPGLNGLCAPELGTTLGIPNIRTVPDDRPGVLAAVNAGQPLRKANPGSPVLAAIDSLVDDLLGATATATPSSGRNLFNRLLHAFKK